MRLSVSAVAIWLCAMGLSQANPAAASIRKDINVPPQELSGALKQFSKASGLHVIFISEDLAARESPGAVGQFTAEEALKQLLRGTGLTYRYLDDSTVTILPGASDEPTNAPLGSRAAPAPNSQGAPPNTGSSSVERTQTGQAVTTDSGTDKVEPQDEQAQKEKKPKPSTLEEVTVTGSHLRGADPLSPVITLSRQDIVDAGKSTLDELLQTLPQDFKAGASQDVNPTTDNGHGRVNLNNSYGSGVNLRGLGTYATLVLLNGQRLAPTADGTVVDISFIPLSIIDHIDVVMDGASSVYGSDAVAGVVNIVTRKDYGGAETTARLGSVTSGTKTDYNLSQLLGTNWSSGNITLAFDHQKLERLPASDRTFASAAPEPLALVPNQTSDSLYVAARQSITDDVAVRAESTYSDRQFSDISTFPDFGGTSTDFGRAENLSLNAALDVRLPRDWRLTLDGTLGREHDHTLFGGTLPFNLTYKTQSLDLRLDGVVRELIGGPVRAGVGISYRTESLDSLENGLVWISSRRAAAAYGELYVPLVGEANALPGVREIDASISARYDRYSDFGSAFDPKFGIKWILTPGIDIHATRSESFRAPPLYYLNEQAFSFAYIEDVRDPQSPTGVTRSLILDGDNAHLKPERARTWNAGMTFGAPEAGMWAVSANYFNIDYSNQIVRLITGFTRFLVDQAVYQAFLQRDPTIQQVQADLTSPPNRLLIDFVGPYSLSQIRVIANLGYENAASTVVRGVDLNGTLRVPMPVGMLTVSSSATYYLNYLQQLTPNAGVLNLRNEIYNPAAFRGNLTLRWSDPSWSAYSRLNYVGSYRDTFNPECQDPNPACHVTAWPTVDVGIAYQTQGAVSRLWRGLRVSADVTNVLDRNPPYTHDQNLQTGYDATNANPLGRFVALQVTKAW